MVVFMMLTGLSAKEMIKGANVFTIVLAPLALKHNFSTKDFEWCTKQP
jgi:hypothetical protein